jgi:hypothetical protein
MSDPITRPTYYEGQILKADDLDASVAYARNQVARHERGLHSWGVASGLNLQAIPGTNAVTVQVNPGVAIDARGRELVLAASRLLDETDFISAFVIDPADPPGTWYPVYISGIDASQTPATMPGACVVPGTGNGPVTRYVEDVQFSFGRPDAPKSPAAPVNVGAADGPDTAPGATLPSVLIGFVQWDRASNHFLDARGDNTRGIDRRTAGVRADRVEARDGSLLLQTSDSGTNGATRLLLRLVEANPSAQPPAAHGFLIFGPDNGQGEITKVFTVSDTGDITVQGNVTVQGTVSSTNVSGKVSIQSGVATDGVVLPPPPGINAADLGTSGIVLHIQVTPRPPRVSNAGPPPGLDGHWSAVPLLCEVDDQRRVSCVMRWSSPDTTATTKILDLSGDCNYLILASVPPAGGNNP